MEEKGVFFGLSLQPNMSYSTKLSDDLVITKCVIDPNASSSDTSRLFIRSKGTEAPICQLDGENNTWASLSIPLYHKTEISFRVAGSCPIHISGYYNIMKAEESSPILSTTRFDLGGVQTASFS